MVFSVLEDIDYVTHIIAFALFVRKFMVYKVKKQGKPTWCGEQGKPIQTVVRKLQKQDVHVSK